jgi:plastocyanin
VQIKELPMANIDVWIQLENNKWDTAPHNIDRMSGQNIAAADGKGPFPGITLTSPVTGATRSLTMFLPMLDAGGNPIDSLIFRRYTPNWAAPDDRKVNPWDLNELNPTDGGTMGTIPGPIIECNVGDQVTVHFRNMDNRVGKDTLARAHSMHVHGFVFANAHDGAYPLSPPDPAQPVGAEAALWSMVGVSGSKRGDRVPPGGSFIYTWKTLGWPTTSGVWLYHDHSICDVENVGLGAIGIIVIHNTADPEDVITPDVPPSGSLVQIRCFPFPFDVPILPHQLETLGAFTLQEAAHAMSAAKPKHSGGEKEHGEEAPHAQFLVQDGDLLLEADKKLQFFRRFCRVFYSAPPTQALYLQLFHELGKTTGSMHINGRKYLGNTPTLIAGQHTKMRFGVVGMGDMFHTFHLHGHRWVLPGPDGNTHVGGGGIGDPAAIQSSPLVKAVSQFEDTKIFGPANSFVFTIHEDAGEGSFMRAEPALGEWHMHCHVLNHMETGMMGSLLVIQGGETVTQLPRGVPCDMPAMPPMDGGVVDVTIQDNLFSPASVTVTKGQKVRWTNNGTDKAHTVTSNGHTGAVFNCSPASSEDFHSGPIAKTVPFEHTFNNPGTYAYHCDIHGCGMAGAVTVNP